MAGIVGMSVSPVDGGAAEPEKPNVILCMADDLGWGDVGYNGNKVIKTPHLDKMAEAGVRFNRFYAAAPVCSPTRASCLTGRHPFRTGVFFANVGILRPEEVTIAEILKKEGYATGHFGKWHLGTFTATEKDGNRGGQPELVNPPTDHGFDTYFSTEAKVPTWDPMLVPKKFQGEENRHFGWNAITDKAMAKSFGTNYWTPNGKATGNMEGDDSRVIMDRVIPFIEKAASSEKPFLAVIWFHAPHLPCVAGPEYAAMYNEQDFHMQQYAGCVTAMDDQMGRLRAKLMELGINENTMLFFTSDNGPERGAPGSAGPYRERKRSLYEGGVRVPGIMTWPNKVKAPFVTDAPVVTSDYLPTVIDVLGLKEPANKLDGVSFLPLLEDKPFTRPSPIAFASQNKRAVNDEVYKLYFDGRKTELYDLEKDPGERANLAKQQPEVVKSFKEKHALWFESCKDSFEGKEYGIKSLETLNQSWPDPANGVIQKKSKKKAKK
ncbi:N-acetylgalactosamine 6-sulfate sulfatase [bacterium F16]|nr:N-acetylgalactosamine 6-sulfate sulfatase [bacterium F16]